MTLDDVDATSVTPRTALSILPGLRQLCTFTFETSSFVKAAMKLDTPEYRVGSMMKHIELWYSETSPSVRSEYLDKLITVDAPPNSRALAVYGDIIAGLFWQEPELVQKAFHTAVNHGRYLQLLSSAPLNRLPASLRDELAPWATFDTGTDSLASAIRLVKENRTATAGCGLLEEYHSSTLVNFDESHEDFGKRILLYLQGKPFASMKMVEHPSILALRSVPGKVFAGGTYAGTPHLVKQASAIWD